MIGIAKRNPIRNLVLFNLTVLMVLLVIIELLLRVTGSQPGLIVDRPPFQVMTDSVILFKDYEADEHGIMKLSREGREYVKRGISNNGKIEDDNYVLINMMIPDYIAVLNEEINNEFTGYISKAKQKPLVERTPVEQAYLDYVLSPINTDGFRSIEFEEYDTTSIKLLLLGDSHTYGAEASNITSSFADILSSMGYIVYNTGIVATDPAQYLAVAKRYISTLNPDVVIVSFCLNNDIMYFKREVKPHQMVFYATNVENLMSCPDGEYLETPQAAYEFIKNECYIPEDDNWFNRICSRSVLSTKLWIVMRKLQMIESNDPERDAYFQRTNGLKSETPVSEYFISQIRDLSKENGSQFLFSAIPDGDDLDKRPEDIPELFNSVYPNIPENTDQEDRAEGGHFNDSGYKKYAYFLDSLIDSLIIQRDNPNP